MYEAGYYKEVESVLEKAPHNIGNICNADCDPDVMAQHGYSWWTEEEVEAWHEAHPIPVTVQDYDDAMEAHLDSEKAERGYTKRSPIEYTGSSNPRWAQDAADWQAHLDEVMEYGLEIMNKHAAGEPVPTLGRVPRRAPQNPMDGGFGGLTE